MGDIAYSESFSQLPDAKGLSLLRSNTVQILLFIFIATLFYSKSEEYKVFRIVYSIFLYLSLFKLLIFYIEASTFKIEIPRFYIIYLIVLGAFLLYNFIFDLNNPAFNIITQINNPYGFLAALNIFAFGLGATTKSLEGFFKVLFYVSIIFIVFCFVPDLPKFDGFHGYICAYAIIPFFILSRYYNRYKLYSYILIGLTVFFSIKSDYRIIIFRDLMFFSLFFSLTLFKRNNFLKFFILLFTCFCIYEFLSDLPEILHFFGRFIEIKSFEVDTRSFLYRELFQDFRSSEVLTGRGFSGTYFSSYFFYNWNNPTEGTAFDRFTLEVGFLQLILKGGYIYYILFIIPLLVSSVKGVFNKNIEPLPFAISIFIFTELILMFIENIPNFGMNFFNLFFLAGYAYTSIKENKESESIEQLASKES